ncbi:GPGG-motif small membrane protein [Streptomonospora sp. PA3]|nr:GPGG-motif small membrane protein [Streptomonospora sp. PA3]
MGILMLILGIVLIVAGIFALVRRQLLWGIVLIVVGVIVAPGIAYLG